MIRYYVGNTRLSWVDCDDVAAVAAACLLRLGQSTVPVARAPHSTADKAARMDWFRDLIEIVHVERDCVDGSWKGIVPRLSKINFLVETITAARSVCLCPDCRKQCPKK